MCELVLPKVTVILRGYETKQVLTVVEQLVGTKVNSIEVASNSPHAMESIAAARKEFGAEVHVGAGTVKNAELARQAIAAGAEFMLSPIMFTQEIFDLAKEAGVITVPAAFSPTEIQKMIDMGADIVKVFPAGQLGPDYLKAVQAPLGKLPLKAAFLLFESVHYGFRAVSRGQFCIDRLEALSYSFDSGREPVA